MLLASFFKDICYTRSMNPCLISRRARAHSSAKTRTSAAADAYITSHITPEQKLESILQDVVLCPNISHWSLGYFLFSNLFPRLFVQLAGFLSVASHRKSSYQLIFNSLANNSIEHPPCWPRTVSTDSLSPLCHNLSYVYCSSSFSPSRTYSSST